MGSLAAVLKRDRLIVGRAFLLVTTVARWYTVATARQMDGPGMQVARPDANAWPVTSLLPIFIMSLVKVAVVPLPGAAPMILTFATVARNRRQHRRPYVPVAVFASGYLAVWGGFGVMATVAQWLLHREALLFVLGVMNLLWIGLLTILIGLEKILPRQLMVSRGTGVLLTIWGIWLLFRA
jgi:predicted metal-binding membrane protein